MNPVSQQNNQSPTGKIWWNADDMAEAKQWESEYLAKGAISVDLKHEDDRPIVNVIITLERGLAEEILGYDVDDDEWLDTSDVVADEQLHESAPGPHG